MWWKRIALVPCTKITYQSIRGIRHRYWTRCTSLPKPNSSERTTTCTLIVLQVLQTNISLYGSTIYIGKLILRVCVTMHILIDLLTFFRLLRVKVCPWLNLSVRRSKQICDGISWWQFLVQKSHTRAFGASVTGLGPGALLFPIQTLLSAPRLAHWLIFRCYN